MSQIGSFLLETIGDVPDHVVVAQLAISLELAKIDQLRERCVWLVLPDFVDLALHLDSVTVVVLDVGVILRVLVSLPSFSFSGLISQT